MPNSTPPDAGWFLDEYDGPRFWEHVIFRGGVPYGDDGLATAVGECWLWNGEIADYGNFRLFGTWWKAHRVAWLDFGQKIPDDLEMDHLCRIHSCVNPAHLKPVAHVENVRRGTRGHIARCPSGHEYTADNTKIMTRNGKKFRYCRTCLAESKHKTYLRSRRSAA